MGGFELSSNAQENIFAPALCDKLDDYW